MAVTDEFFGALASGSPFILRDPRTGGRAREVEAREIFDALVGAAWACGDPGLIFLDRINFFNPTPRLGEMESTNPCGEQPLLPYESCNLGSLNLARFVTESRVFDWGDFRRAIHDTLRFLDNVIDLNVFPVEASRQITLKNRKVGLGVMGLADALLELGLRYDSEPALRFGEAAMSFLDREAKRASAELARERGPFAGFRDSLWARLGYPKLRNATVSTVAPTGTLSLLAGCSSGIEPVYAGVLTRHVLEGAQLTDVHPWIAAKVASLGRSIQGLTEDDCRELGGEAWAVAAAIDPEWHVRMQAAFQRHSDSAVSKTINLPRGADRESVARAFSRAFELGCKGITVYRDGSYGQQVLSSGESEGKSGAGSCPVC